MFSDLDSNIQLPKICCMNLQKYMGRCIYKTPNICELNYFYPSSNKREQGILCKFDMSNMGEVAVVSYTIGSNLFCS